MLDHSFRHPLWYFVHAGCRPPCGSEVCSPHGPSGRLPAVGLAARSLAALPPIGTVSPAIAPPASAATPRSAAQCAPAPPRRRCWRHHGWPPRPPPPRPCAAGGMLPQPPASLPAASAWPWLRALWPGAANASVPLPAPFSPPPGPGATRPPDGASPRAPWHPWPKPGPGKAAPPPPPPQQRRRGPGLPRKSCAGVRLCASPANAQGAGGARLGGPHGQQAKPHAPPRPRA
mmetsp:Transcript_129615/g.276440  ORF Transcript_129615/g.276440 Transcript_129615/m.276440 type:complete len:231 (+) Transcript_129615:160-852(+)